MLSGGALAGKFLIGTGVLLPAGMLTALSEALLMLASRLVGTMGVERSLRAAFFALIGGFALLALGFGSFAAAMAAAGLWGLGSFALDSMQQSRLVNLAPELASASVALNTSAVYLGQAVGIAAGGGAMAGAGVSPAFALVAVGFLLAGFAASALAGRMARG